MINKEVISLSTKEFLSNLKSFFDKYFSAGEEKGKRNRVRETG